MESTKTSVNIEFHTLAQQWLPHRKPLPPVVARSQEQLNTLWREKFNNSGDSTPLLLRGIEWEKECVIIIEATLPSAGDRCVIERIRKKANGQLKINSKLISDEYGECEIQNAAYFVKIGIQNYPPTNTKLITHKLQPNAPEQLSDPETEDPNLDFVIL